MSKEKLNSLTILSTKRDFNVDFNILKKIAQIKTNLNKFDYTAIKSILLELNILRKPQYMCLWSWGSILDWWNRMLMG